MQYAIVANFYLKKLLTYSCHRLRPTSVRLWALLLIAVARSRSALTSTVTIKDGIPSQKVATEWPHPYGM